MGQSPDSATYNTTGDGLPFFQGKADFGEVHPSPRFWCSAPNRTAQKNDVLLSVRAPVGPTNIADQECCIGRGLAAIRPKPKLDYRFLFYYLRSVGDAIAALGQGSTFSSISKKQLADVEVPSAPLDEQRRIVARIEEFARRVAEAYQHREEAVHAISAWLPSALSTTFEELTDLHGARPLKGLFSFRNDLLRPIDKMTGEVRFIGLQHIESNTGRRIGEDLVLAEQLTGRKFRFSPGEIVYGYLRPYLNKVWIADCEGLCSVDQYVLQPNNLQVDTSYLAYAMRSPFFLRQSEQLTGVLTLPRLRSGLLESIEIPLPPLDEQRRVAAYLDALQAKADAIRAAQLATQKELDALLPSVLDRAFRGEL
jgi:type I restriction enzyme, S subunit